MFTLFGSNKVLKHYSRLCVIPGLPYPELLHEREIHIYLFIKEIKSVLGEPTQHTNTEVIVNGSFLCSHFTTFSPYLLCLCHCGVMGQACCFFKKSVYLIVMFPFTSYCNITVIDFYKNLIQILNTSFSYCLLAFCLMS